MVTTEEADLAQTLGASGVTDELDAMALAMHVALGFDASQSTPAVRGDSEVRALTLHPTPVTGLAAAPESGKPRATTSDTYRFFRETAGAMGPDDHVLIVTSAIHAPFQHAQAIAELVLPNGPSLTSVGAHIATTSYSAVRRDWTTAEWLQEIRSALWSMKQMYAALINQS